MVQNPDILGAFLLSTSSAIFLGWLEFGSTKKAARRDWILRLFYIFLGMTIALGVVLFSVAKRPDGSSGSDLQTPISENFCGLGSRLACYQDDGSAVTW